MYQVTKFGYVWKNTVKDYMEEFKNRLFCLSIYLQVVIVVESHRIDTCIYFDSNDSIWVEQGSPDISAGLS